MLRGISGGWRPWLLIRGHTWLPHKGNKVVKREPRSTIQGPIIYRQTSGLIWHNGALENVSASGVLFRGEKALLIDTPIEMSFALPPASGAKCGTQIFCWGKVARCAAPAGSDERAVLAARVLRYRAQAQAVPDIRYKTAA